MKFKLGSLWKTRDGSKARIICNDKEGEYPIVALISDERCNEHYVGAHDADGILFTTQTSPKDLIEPWVEPKPKLKAWMHKSGDGVTFRPEGQRVNIDGYIRAEWLDQP